MMKGKFVAFGMALAMALASGSALAGDAAEGEKVFKKRCRACHTMDEGKHKVGPSLAGTFGRKAGTAEGFNRYRGLKDADFTWNEENLDKWLEDPKKFLGKPTSMTFKLRKEEDREDVIAYLKAN